MKINELSSVINNKYVVLKLNYEDIKDITNALYHCCSETKHKEYLPTYYKLYSIFGLVKEGVPYETSLDETIIEKSEE